MRVFKVYGKKSMAVLYGSYVCFGVIPIQFILPQTGNNCSSFLVFSEALVVICFIFKAPFYIFPNNNI